MYIIMAFSTLHCLLQVFIAFTGILALTMGAISTNRPTQGITILQPTWGKWSNWTECSKTCGGGSKSRSRECLHDGRTTLNCTGNSVDVQSCNTHCCRVNGGFTPWSNWSVCNVTCGNGTQYRSRNCSNPVPSCGGSGCIGTSTDVMSCEAIPCPVDCTWLDWSDWSACNQTCGGGQRYRIRVSSPALYGGKNCSGASEEKDTCNSQPCPVDGYWGQWTQWSACSFTCGSGVQTRTRVCLPPLYGGLECVGDSQQTRTCEMVPCPIDCQWTDWGNWTQCSVTCNGGTRTRSRQYLMTAQYGGKGCAGEGIQTNTCNTQPCPVDCSWIDWSDWSVCNQTCGGGQRYRIRVSSPALYGGKNCSGASEEIETCNSQPCPVDGYWGQWTEWSACSFTCGSGVQTRTRVCVPPLYRGLECVGDSQQTRTCEVVPCPIDCQWTDWGNWTQCSVTCNGGSRTRSRHYLVTAQYGGKGCAGEGIQTNTCNTQPCPVDCSWLDWSDWSACNQTCGGGQRYRIRVSSPALYGGKNCSGASEEKETCNSQPCPVDGYWGQWTQWSACSLTCGSGIQTRTRVCVPPLYGGLECVGNSQQSRTCEVVPCPIDCQWTDWGNWTQCSVTCNGGTRTRSRQYLVTAQYGGKGCAGEGIQTNTCNTQPCPVDCSWLDWSDWSACNQTCGGGQRYRIRVSSPALYGGKNCSGASKEKETCNSQPCPVDGYWGQWTQWSACSFTCGSGVQTRTRVCVPPLYGGLECVGDSQQSRTCEVVPCPIDCQWTDWGNWTQCSVTCNGGNHTRSRQYLVTAQYGGKGCAGESIQTSTCNSQPCPVDGYWGQWTQWSACSFTCGSGVQTRTRVCVPPLYGGLECVGDSQQSRTCEVVPCPIDCQWTDWGNWTQCSVTCNGGTRTRSRQYLVTAQYGGKGCAGEGIQTNTCNTQPCPDPCKDHGNPCYNALVECTPLSETQFRCGSCPIGLTGNGVTCISENECNLTAPCFPGVKCTDLWLGYSCGACPSGYNGSSTCGPDLAYALTHKQNCSDINECAAIVSPCDPLRQCINTIGSYLCGPCPIGYVNNGSTECLLTDPCAAKVDNCQEDAYCSNTALGVFTCQCPSRMYGNGVYCIPYGDFDGMSGIPFPADFSYIDNDDMDLDGIVNEQDNCPYVPNADQIDYDRDLVGDACDNCRSIRNTNQADLDRNGIGDDCDGDADGDNFVNIIDTCPRLPNPTQKDTDSDGFGDNCDNCVFIKNGDQADSDCNGIGDICDTHLDKDRDGRQDDMDNCPVVPNADQADADGDGVGDVCDHDKDNDGLLNGVDSCPLVYNPSNDSNKCAGDYDGDLVPNDVDECPSNAKFSTTDFTYFNTVPLTPSPDRSKVVAANWNAKKASDVVITAQSDPYLLLGPTPFSSLEYTGTFYVSKSTSHGYIGVVFNYHSNKQFMLAAWKQNNETMQASGYTGLALAGMQVKLINSTTGPSSLAMSAALWNTGDTEGQVKTLWKDPSFQGWKTQNPYKWKILYSIQTSCMRVTTYNGVNMQLLTDSGCICNLNLRGGRVGMFSYKQDNVVWTNVHTKCYIDKQMQC